jgi:hypothetical protein
MIPVIILVDAIMYHISAMTKMLVLMIAVTVKKDVKLPLTSAKTTMLVPITSVIPNLDVIT